MEAKLSEIAGRLGCGVRVRGGADQTIRHLLTDSRSLFSPADSIFFAIKTPSADGHRYVRALYERGVRAFIVEQDPVDADRMPGAVLLKVGNSVEALRAIGSMGRENAAFTLAITGSRGKTTLKEWLFQLLSPLAGISRSPRSFNSRIGVPLSLWEIEPRTDLAIIEAGISRKGEMEALREIIRPDAVILTNIGDAHSEGFLSKLEKTREKLLLADSPQVGTLIYPMDSDVVRKGVAELKERRPELRLIGWSTTDPEAPLSVGKIKGALEKNGKPVVIYYTYRATPTGKILAGEFEAPLDSLADFENAMSALAFMLFRGVPQDKIAERFRTLCKPGTRLNVSEGVNGCQIIRDSYTSDFSSLVPAIDFMRRRLIPGQSLTVIMSDLLHESRTDDRLYADIAEALAAGGVTRFIGVGPELKRHARFFPPETQFFDSVDELLSNLTTSDFSSETILLKEAPGAGFGRIAEMLEARTHETVLEVNLDSVIKNYNYFRSHVPAGTGIVAMVKASGYGAGSFEIAKTLQDCGAAYLAVAVLDEGIDLRRNGITMPIMVMNPKVVSYRQMFANRLEPEIYSFGMLGDVIREAAKNGVTDYPVHLKFDTGMHRMGFLEEEIPEILEVLSGQQGVKVSSVFSHLATADCPDMDDYTLKQLATFDRLTNRLAEGLPYGFRRHILNSAGILRFPQYHYDMVRLGIGLYGVNTLPESMERPLAVVSTLRTVIIAIREWEAGESIGYGRRTVLQRRSRVATIPIGYADGMNRHFGRGAISVKVNGRDAPTLGNICMDACMIDVTDINCRPGDSVEIFGQEADVQRLADALDTIPYEILTSVSPRVKRVYYRE